MAGFLDTYLALKTGIQPVFVVNGAATDGSGELQLRNSWLDQVDQLQQEILSEVFKQRDDINFFLENSYPELSVAFLDDEVRVLTKQVDSFLGTLREHCIKSKPKKIDEFYAKGMPQISELIQNLNLRIESLGNLSKSYSELILRFKEQFGQPAYDRLENYYRIRNNIELSDLEEKMKPKNFKAFVEEVESDIDGPLHELVELYNSNTSNLQEFINVVQQIWNETIENGAASDSSMSLFEPALGVVMVAEAQSLTLATNLNKAFERFEKRISVIA